MSADPAQARTPCTPTVRVQAEAFDLAAESDRLARGRANIGAIVTFSGLCRDEGGTLAALEIEHYPGMAEAEILRVAQDACGRWPLLGLTAIHRFGRIRPAEPIVGIVAAAAHRADAFAGASFMMDFMKTRAPFWKREIGPDGTAGEWVAAKATDDDAAEQW